MPSQWSTVDPARRRIFLVGIAVIAALLAVLLLPGLFGSKPKSPGKRANPRPARPPAAASPVPVPPSEVPLPPGQTHDDSQPGLSAGPTGPLELPPRFDKPPGAPLSDADLKAATDRALAFLEVFANGRWNDKPEDLIPRISKFVPQGQLDAVLAQFQKVRPKAETHEIVTYRVTAARWAFLGEAQAGLAVDGDRAVRDDKGTKTVRRGFVVNLLKGGAGSWSVTSVRDPGEGDTGQR